MENRPQTDDGGEGVDKVSNNGKYNSMRKRKFPFVPCPYDQRQHCHRPLSFHFDMHKISTTPFDNKLHDDDIQTNNDKEKEKERHILEQQRHLLRLSCKRKRRLFPSISVLVTQRQQKQPSSSSTSPTTPLIQKFYDSIQQLYTSSNESVEQTQNYQRRPQDKSMLHDRETKTTLGEVVATTAPISNVEKENKEKDEIDGINNCNLSILSKGQHQRYMQLFREMFTSSTNSSSINIITSSSTGNSKKKKYNEYKKIHKIVCQEQKLYLEKLNDYVTKHLSIFQLGFVTNSNASKEQLQLKEIALVNSRIISNYKEKWWLDNGPCEFRYYGRCIQSINTTSSSSPSSSSLFFESISSSSKVVYKTDTDESNISKISSKALNNLLKTGSVVDNNNVQIPTTKNISLSVSQYQQQDNKNEEELAKSTTATSHRYSIPSVSLLRDDPTATQLAEKYKVDIVTTCDTLQTLLLQLPRSKGKKEYSTTGMPQNKSFMIPLTTLKLDQENKNDQRKRRKIATSSSAAKQTRKILDVPMPRSLTPRECLSKGFEVALLGSLPELSRNANTRTTSPVFGGDTDNQCRHQKCSHGEATTDNINSASTDPNCQHSQRSQLKEEHSEKVQHVYTILTLPSRQRYYGGRQCKILVRSTNHLILEDDESENESKEEETTAVRLHVQLEYFYTINNQCLEEYTSSQKALWILDHLLQSSSSSGSKNGGCRVITARICPQNCKLLRVEEKSIAHALLNECDSLPMIGKEVEALVDSGQQLAAVYDTGCGDDDPLDRIHTMIELLYGIDTIECGTHMLCFPERRGHSTKDSSMALTSISVHKLLVDSEEQQQTKVATVGDNQARTFITAIKGNEDDACIDVARELDAACLVYMSTPVLRSCFRRWKWSTIKAPSIAKDLTSNDDNDDQEKESIERIPYTFPISSLNMATEPR